MARPSFKPTAAQRRQVAAAAGGGMSHDEISAGLGLARNTLEKHFAHELMAGACAKRLEVIEAMHRAAKRGNVAAAKAYLATPMRGVAPPAPEPEVKQPPRGKKEQASVEAAVAQVGTDWEQLLKTPAPPVH